MVAISSFKNSKNANKGFSLIHLNLKSEPRSKRNMPCFRLNTALSHDSRLYFLTFRNPFRRSFLYVSAFSHSSPDVMRKVFGRKVVSHGKRLNSTLSGISRVGQGTKARYSQCLPMDRTFANLLISNSNFEILRSPCFTFDFGAVVISIAAQTDSIAKIL